MMRIKKNNPVVISLAVIAIFIFLHFTGLLRGPENLFFSLIQPLSSRFYGWSSSLSQSYQGNKDISSLQAEVSNLKQQVSELTVANSRFLETVEENKKLRLALNFQEENQLKLVTAGIVSKMPFGTNSRDLVINRGARDGIRKGLGVISEEGVIVGKVIEVKDNSALVCLTTSPNCRLAAALQNQYKTQGLTDGDLGLTIRMDYIPQLEKIALNDLVITSGLDGDIPRGLVIGRVMRIKNESNEVWQEATIEPLLDYGSLTIVSVVIS